ncbi:M14 family zinc carboxypeptidase [Flavobacterium cerinum]|uniref:IPT/TIG domain-containing protein n=1 Tax=Flavobacterium cerinum TaxID=2502784 RepID=A0ABY5IRX8_9FLAO|nr:M14 family zinc carboxypeptidase [Flavobacterium cerinum]UUC45550.1 IPT/TIG domain-containing protein [Flavobacterium cerinum]
MKKTTLIILFLLSSLSVVFAQTETNLAKAQYYLKTKGEVIFTFQAANEQQFKKLAAFLSLSHKRVNQDDLKVEAYADKITFDKFLTYNIPFQVRTEDNEIPSAEANKNAMAPNAQWDTTWDAYPTYSQYVAKMQYYANTYPNLCKLENIGSTPNGRNLWILKISDNCQTDEAEPEFFYSSSMHGDEITGFPLMMRLIDHLVTRYGTDSEVTNMVNTTEIYISPLSNPDGSYKTTGNDVMNSAGNTATRANANGRDLNRNYPDPLNGLHPDTFAYQPETLAFLAFEKTRNFVMAANFHGGVEVVNYPWDAYASPNHLHPHDNYFKFISKNYAQSCQNASNNNGYMDDVFAGQYPGTTNGSLWYTVSGGRQDYNNYYMHNKEVTIEISTTKFPAASELPNFWNYNKQAFLDHIKQANYGLQGKVTDMSGNPINAKVYIPGYDLKGAWVKTGSLHGDYYKLLIAGNYNITFEAPGYVSQTIAATVANNATTVLNVQMVATTAEPTVTNATICKGKTATLSTADSGTIRWYDTATSTTALATASSYTTPTLTTTRSYFVEREVALANVGPVTPTGSPTAKATVANKYLVFDCTTPTKLKSVSIRPSAIGEILVELQDSSGAMLESKVIRITGTATQDIDLDFYLPAQNNLRLVSREINGFNLTVATSGITYPMTNNTVSIKSNSGTGTFFQFFNWKFAPLKSARKEVTVTVKPDPTITTISPDTALEGGANFTLIVTGTNFVNGESVIRWNGVNKATTFISTTQLSTTITAADIANDGTATVSVINTCNNYVTPNTNFTIQGVPCATSTTWNGSSWSNSAPNNDVHAIINGNFTSTGNLEACSLTISGTAVVTIQTGHNFIINREVTVAATANLIIQNNANLVQVENNTNSGNSNVYRNSSPMIRLDYTNWSSPVASQNLLAFSPQTLTNRFYIYNPLNGPIGAYETINPSTNAFTAGKGYLIRIPNTWSATTPAVFSGHYTGVLNNGNVNINVQRGTTTGYNLIGNPYPSTINAIDFINANISGSGTVNTTIDGSLYFWTHATPSSPSTGLYPLNNYAKYTKLGGTAAQAGGAVPNGIIQVGQGFLVNAVTNGAVSFRNSMRLINNANQFFKINNAPALVENEAIEKHRIWLNLSGNNDAFSQILIGYMTGATVAADYGIDAKDFGASGAALYSTIGNEAYAIQGRPVPFDNNDSVALGVNIPTAGNYNISIDHFDGLFTGEQYIFLKDKTLNTIHDLKQNSYGFSAEEGVNNDRFELVFKNSTLGNHDFNADIAAISVSKQNSEITVRSSKENLISVAVYDLLGRLIYQSEKMSTPTYTTNLFTSEAVLLVKVITETNQTVFKKVL